jgi:hypothetical protein
MELFEGGTAFNGMMSIPAYQEAITVTTDLTRNERFEMMDNKDPDICVSNQ